MATVTLRLRRVLVSLAAGRLVCPAAGSAVGLQARCVVSRRSGAHFSQRVSPGRVCGAGGDRPAAVLDADRAGSPVRGDVAPAAVPRGLLCVLVRADLPAICGVLLLR